MKTCHFPDSPSSSSITSSSNTTLSYLKFQYYHTIKDDGIVCRLKFVRIGEDYQEYGLFIPETMLTEAIKQSESYQMFIKYSTGQIPLMKSRGKGSQRKRIAADSQETVDVSEESEPEPKSAKRKTSSNRRVKKKVTLSADDNIIFDDPDTSLEIVTESVLGPTKIIKSGKLIFDPPKKLKGVPSLCLEEQEAVDIMKALKESKKTNTRQPNDETESDEDDIYKCMIRVRKDKDEEMINAKVDDSDKGDEEVIDAAKEDAKKTLKVKDDAKKTELPPTSSSLFASSGFCDLFHKLSFDSSLVSTVKDTTDAEINSLLQVKIRSEVPHIQSPSMLRVPVSVIFEPSVLTPVQESPSKATVTTLPPPSVSTSSSVPQQITTPIPTPTITTDASIITSAVYESDALSAVQLRVVKLEKYMYNLQKMDLSAEALAALKTQVPFVVDNYLRSKVGDVFQKELKKHRADLIHKYSLH
uniref:Uncharacterized protein n=1 Tax=Tanacetum cinerariifolium TaxID=118510 RepID=A0A699GQ82_TANCI|nr:hypothetical protein [Tanacetum cinerariifolium]